MLIVGGGIHGVGILHDLASRRIGGVHLAERERLASGTSSRTTKLMHGGLRYLAHLSQWGLVRDALRERALLLKNLPEVVRPIPFVLPVFRSGRPSWMIRLGLRLYESLATTADDLPRARRLGPHELGELAPYLHSHVLQHEISTAFLFYEAQMQDDVIVRLAARAAARLGATYAEETFVDRVECDGQGFRVRLVDAQGVNEVTCRVLVNAAGAWCNANLLRWGFLPQVTCLLNVGSHLVLSPSAIPANPDHCAAAALQHEDGRLVFFIPWAGRWLLGTTESQLEGTPEKWTHPPGDREYLLNIAKQYLALVHPGEQVIEAFCGIRTIPIVRRSGRASSRVTSGSWTQAPFSSPFYVRKWNHETASLSRKAVIDEYPGHRLVSIYGGKFTTYRALSETVGDRIAQWLGQGGECGTKARQAWFLDDLQPAEAHLFRSQAELRQGRISDWNSGRVIRQPSFVNRGIASSD
ncbi:FAD-dependent oxidoreductase [Nitrospira tepida]|uniref:FAD-dependent oxidoreductase n=1 Tax=Nitrospira tepida TaxID=2973512 RepID=A0AA86N3F4_9BACT|nr:FAD-dependent oxidoreductase [Nitrospira tepida]